MTTLCAITGTLRDLTGAVLPSTQITFVRTGVAAQDGSTIIPRVVTSTSDVAGLLNVTLYAGNYTATTIGAVSGTQTFAVAVPSTATAVLADLINAAPTTVTPQAVIDAQAARDAAIAAQVSAANDAASTAADRTQTGLDRDAAAASAQAAANASVNTGSVKLAANEIISNMSVPAGFNASSVGPISIAAGVTVDVADGSRWAII